MALVVVLGVGALLAALVGWGIDTSVVRFLPKEQITEAVSTGGTYAVSWSPIGGEVPLNDYFELELFVDPPPESVRVDCRMPDHGHGMNVRPRVHDLGRGRYRVDGLLLHMAGRWILRFELGEESAEFEVFLL